MPVNLYYTQKVRGFQQENIKYSKESVELRLKRTKHQCPYCASTAVTVEPIRSRRICGEPLGCCRNVVLEFSVPRLYCHCCHHSKMEYVPFLFHPKARLTKTLERTILELRQHMSIQALANFYDNGFRDREYFKLKKYISCRKFQAGNLYELLSQTSDEEKKKPLTICYHQRFAKGLMVGVVELESTTSTMSTWRSNQLSYTPSCYVI